MNQNFFHELETLIDFKATPFSSTLAKTKLKFKKKISLEISKKSSNGCACPDSLDKKQPTKCITNINDLDT